MIQTLQTACCSVKNGSGWWMASPGNCIKCLWGTSGWESLILVDPFKKVLVWRTWFVLATADGIVDVVDDVENEPQILVDFVD